MPDGADVHLLSNPVGTFAGNALLLEPVGELQPVAVENKRLFLGLVRVKRRDEARFAEEEIQMVDLVEVFAERVVSVDREIGGDDREPRAGVNLRLEKIRDGTAMVIVPDA